MTPDRLQEIAALCGNARDTFGEVTTSRQRGGPTLFCTVRPCSSEQPCWKHDEERLQRAYIVGNQFLEVVPELLDEVERLEARIQELLALTVRLTNEVPFPDEVRGWLAQRAAMIAEIGTLKARIVELGGI